MVINVTVVVGFPSAKLRPLLAINFDDLHNLYMFVGSLDNNILC